MTAKPPGTGNVPQIPPGVLWMPPTRPAAIVLGVPGLAFAAVGARLVAYVLDSLVLLVARVALILVAAGIAGESPGVIVAVGIVSVALDYAYFVILWTGPRRSSLGMRLFRLQVGRAFDGHRLDLGRASMRWLAFGGWLGVLGSTPEIDGMLGVAVFVWMFVLLVSTAISDTRQGLHDRLARTAVVGPEGGWNTGLARGCLAGLVVIVALQVLVIIILALFGEQMSTILSEVGSSI